VIQIAVTLNAVIRNVRVLSVVTLSVVTLNAVIRNAVIRNAAILSVATLSAAIRNVVIRNAATQSAATQSVTALSVAVTEVLSGVQILVPIVVVQIVALISVRNAAFAFRLDQLWESRAVAAAMLAPVPPQAPIVLCAAQAYCAE
jgi:hypothetical protein